MVLKKDKSNFFDSGKKLMVVLLQGENWYCTITDKLKRGFGVSESFEDTIPGRGKLRKFIRENFGFQDRIEVVG